MAPARDRLAKAIDQIEFRDPEGVVIANVDAADHPRGTDWPELLKAQLCSPVRWRQTLRTLDQPRGIARDVPCSMQVAEEAAQARAQCIRARRFSPSPVRPSLHCGRGQESCQRLVADGTHASVPTPIL